MRKSYRQGKAIGSEGVIGDDGFYGAWKHPRICSYENRSACLCNGHAGQTDLAKECKSKLMKEKRKLDKQNEEDGSEKEEGQGDLNAGMILPS